MYQVNDMVMYAGSGLCRIDDISRRKFYGGEEKLYYILKPVYETTSTVYVPVNNEKAKIRKILTKEDILQLLRLVPDCDTLWINDDRARQERFGKILQSGDHVQMIRLIVEIHEKRRERQQQGRKLRTADEKALQEAEKFIHQEFGYALNLRPDQVAPFIMEQLNIQEGDLSMSPKESLTAKAKVG